MAKKQPRRKPPLMTEAKMTVREKVLERLRHVGRIDEYLRKRSKLNREQYDRAGHCFTNGQIWSIIMFPDNFPKNKDKHGLAGDVDDYCLLEFYFGPKREHELYDEMMAEKRGRTRDGQVERMQNEIREERHIADFEEACRTLPATATIAEELNWVRSHPAMMRSDRQSDATKKVVLSATDVLYGPTGKAPSQAAVVLLQKSCNNNKFFEGLNAEAKKHLGATETATASEADESLDEVERLLKSVMDDGS